MIWSTAYPAEEGIGNYVTHLARKLVDRGHKVLLVTRGGLGWRDSKQINGVVVREAPFMPVYPFHVQLHGLFVDSLVRSLRKNLDLIHIHSPLSPSVRVGIPVVATMHSALRFGIRSVEVVDRQSAAIKLQGVMSLRIEEELLRNAQYVTTVSRSVASEFMSCGFRGEIDVVGNGVDEKFYLPGKDRREDNTILYVGRLAYRKGLFDLLASSKTILKERPDAKFLIVGKGPLRGLLEKRVKDAGVETSFQFLGFLPLKDLQSIYRSAAVCVVPSHYEGQPTTLLEAMSSGAPIVGTNIPSISGVLTHDVDGILAQSKSPELLANAIIGLMNDGEKRAEIGQNARRTVEKAFTWDIVTDRIENSYGKINPELE